MIVRRMAPVGRGVGTNLSAVCSNTFAATMARIGAYYPNVLVEDKFCYVPNGPLFDAETRVKGIVTVLPDGRFRSGNVAFPKMLKPFSSVAEMLAAA